MRCSLFNNTYKARVLGAIISVFPCFLYAQVNNKPIAETQPPLPSLLVATATGVYSTGTPINYVRTWDAMGPWTDPATFNTQTYTEVKQSTAYVDGLGRALQTVLKQNSPGNNPNDFVIPFVYDELSREQYKYMGYISSTANGNFKSDPFTEQQTFLVSQFSGEQVFYSKTDFEAAPLNRPVKTFAQGNSWAGNGRGTEFKYLINTTADEVRIWTNGTSGVPTSSTGSVYNAGELYKNVVIDETGNSVVEYKDKDGLIILKKVQIGAVPADYSGHENWLCTYYVYDELNRLCFVIPPKAVNEIRKPTLNWVMDATAGGLADELCFQYRYDSRSRMIAKKIPGSGWDYMIYDKRDRLVFTQDANMRTKNQWHVILYEELNKPVLTGMVIYAGSQSQLQSYVDIHTTGTASPTTITVTGRSTELLHDITINSSQINHVVYQATNSISLEDGFETDNTTDFTAEIIPSSGTDNFSDNISINNNPVPSGIGIIPLTLTYYDKYISTNRSYNTTNNNKLDAGSNLHAEPLPNISEQSAVLTSGMTTIMRVRTLPDPLHLDAGNWLNTTYFYDNKGRVIQTQYDNYKGGNDITNFLYDFSGKLLCNYLVHANPQNPNVDLSTIAIKTNMEYDYGGRLLEIWKTINDDPNKKLIVKNEYDELGQLNRKILGKKPGSTDPIETLDYNYNIRGWLQGINKDYANGSTDRWFGMELNYDWGFTNKQYTGNIAGTKWRSKGDGKQRAYGFGYDQANRLMFADFKQLSTNGWDNSENVDFTSLMGNGVDANLAYDENGNIKSIKQFGLKLNSSPLIDNLEYNYISNSNKLLNVNDLSNDNQTKLGDFRASELYQSFVPVKTATTQDYKYDLNGNLTIDKNKDIYGGLLSGGQDDGIIYNYLNLPSKIFVRQQGREIVKGTINYLYDATGNKLEKEVVDGNTFVSKKTSYIGGFIYEDDVMQFFGHEEGRIRPKITAGQSVSFVYDYFIKDHLGNVRMVLSDEVKPDAVYKATMEDANRATEVQLFSQVPETEFTKPGGFDTDNDNHKVSQLFSVGGSADPKRMGPGVLLKVMAGDKFSANVFGWYQPNTTSADLPPGSVNILGNLVSAFTGSVISQANIGHVLPTPPISSDLNAPITAFLNYQSTQSTPGIPKGYLNWIVLDEEQFKLVEGNYGAVQIPAISGSMNKQVMQADNGADIEIKKNGYLYVYVSNESAGNVYFDNLTVKHIKGPLMEETHYYPFGLVMSGISSNSAGSLINHKKFNGKEEQRQEFSDGSGLEWLDYGARMYDNQLMRWMAPDPMAGKYESWSPYVYCLNDPIIFVDPDGRTVDPASQKEWDKQKQAVTDQRNKLQTKVDGFNAQAKAKGWSAEKLAGKIGDLNDRIAGLNGSLTNLGNLEASKQNYSLKTGAGEEGGTTYDPKTGNIVFSFGSTSNFVHETTHGGQFETGDFAFDNKTGMPYGQDVHDEVAAYKAQFAYDPSSVSGLTSSSTANSFGAITTGWVQGITKSDGDKLYAPGGSANTGISPVNINTNRDGLIAAYPGQAAVLKTLPADFTLKSIPTIYYKK